MRYCIPPHLNIEVLLERTILQWITREKLSCWLLVSAFLPCYPLQYSFIPTEQPHFSGDKYYLPPLILPLLLIYIYIFFNIRYNVSVLKYILNGLLITCPGIFFSDPPLTEDDVPSGEWVCHRCTLLAAEVSYSILLLVVRKNH